MQTNVIDFIRCMSQDSLCLKSRNVRLTISGGLVISGDLPLTSDAHLADGEHNPVIACFKTIFKFAEKLVNAGLAGGALAQREVAWHFQPHRVTPNGHLLNTPVPITLDVAKELLFLFERQ